MGKLDYLEKYTNSSIQTKSKRKEKKKKKQKDDSIQLQDEDEFQTYPAAYGELGTDEDQPVIVMTEGSIGNQVINQIKNVQSVVKYDEVYKNKREGGKSDRLNRQCYSEDHKKKKRGRKKETSQGHGASYGRNRKLRYDLNRMKETSVKHLFGPNRGLTHEIVQNKLAHTDDEDLELKCNSMRSMEGGKISLAQNERNRYESDDEKTFQMNCSDENNFEEIRQRKRHDSDDEIDAVVEIRKRKHDTDSCSNESEIFYKLNKYGVTTSSETSKALEFYPRKRIGSEDYSNEDDQLSCKHYEVDEESITENNQLTSYLRNKIGERRKKLEQIWTTVSSEVNNARDRMSSGHIAGLQKAADFRGAEKELQKRRKSDAESMIDKYGIGETVFRDGYGHQLCGNGKRKIMQMDTTERASLDKGRIQKERETNIEAEKKNLQESAFARYVNDIKLEGMRRNAIRAEDPMASYATKKEAKIEVRQGNPERRFYIGPKPKPNRFGIKPGYRWDGVDRGNAFEDKVLANKYSINYKKEAAYRWSTSDM